MPKPTSPATALVVQTPRRRIIAMSIIGTGTRSSTWTQATMPRAAAAKSARMVGEAQPSWLPSLRPSSSATSQRASSTAGSSGNRAGVRTGDSGMKP